LAADQAQIKNALQTIDRISQNTQFGTKRLLDGSSAAVATLGVTGASNVASVSAGSNTVAGTYQVAITQQGLAAQLVGTNFTSGGTVVNSQVTNLGTALAAGTSIASTGASATAVGTYTIAVTHQGLGDALTGASAGASNAAAGSISFSGGSLGTNVVNVVLGASLAASAAASAIGTALGAGYSVTASAGGVITIQDLNIGAQANALAVAGVSGGASATTGIGGSQVGTTGQNVQVSITGGSLTGPVVLNGNGAGGTGAQVTVGSGPAQGLIFNVYKANGATAAVGATGTVTVSGSDTLTLNGTLINLTANNAYDAAHAAAAINTYTSTTGVSATVNNNALVLTATKLGGTNFTVGESGGNIGITNTTVFAQNAQSLQANIYDASGNQLGGTITGAGAGGNVITAVGTSFGNANGISFTFNYASGQLNGVSNTASPTNVPTGQYTASVTFTDGLQFQIGANSNQTAALSIVNTDSKHLGRNVAGLNNSNTDSLSKIDVTTTAGANDALKVIDQAISDVSTIRGNIGSFQTNTLQATAANLQTTLTNTTAAQSVIRDTDFAAETANFTKNQVLVQAGTTVLTNANATAQLILNLLK
jgi:flagellin